MGFGTGPGPELFTIVTTHNGRVGELVSEAAEILDRFVRILPGNGIAEFFAAWENLQQPAFFLSEVVAMHLVGGHAAVAKVEVVEQRVFDAGVGDVGGERLFPHTFGNPHPADASAEMVFEIFRVKLHLADAVAAGNAGEDRLVEGPAEDFELTPFNEAADEIDVLRVVVNQPFQQAARDVQDHRQVGIVGQNFQQGEVTVLISPFEHSVEITDRLVIVKDEGQSQTIHGELPEDAECSVL